MKNIILKALPGGVTDMVLVMLMALLGRVLGISAPEMTTAATVLLATIGMMVLRDVSRPMTWDKKAIWGISAAGLVFSFLFLKSLFGITATMGWPVLALLAVFLGLAWPTLKTVKKMVS